MTYTLAGILSSFQVVLTQNSMDILQSVLRYTAKEIEIPCKRTELFYCIEVFRILNVQ